MRGYLVCDGNKADFSDLKRLGTDIVISFLGNCVAITNYSENIKMNECKVRVTLSSDKILDDEKITLRLPAGKTEYFFYEGSYLSADK